MSIVLWKEPMADGNRPMISEQAIRERSYLIWQSEGCPHGRALDHWLRAKDELERELHEAVLAPTDLSRELDQTVLLQAHVVPQSRRRAAQRLRSFSDLKTAMLSGEFAEVRQSRSDSGRG